MANRKIVMIRNYEPTTNRKARTLYAGNAYTVPEEVANEVREAGAGRYANESAPPDEGSSEQSSEQSVGASDLVAPAPRNQSND